MNRTRITHKWISLYSSLRRGKIRSWKLIFSMHFFGNCHSLRRVTVQDKNIQRILLCWSDADQVDSFPFTPTISNIKIVSYSQKKAIKNIAFVLMGAGSIFLDIITMVRSRLNMFSLSASNRSIHASNCVWFFDERKNVKMGSEAKNTHTHTSIVEFGYNESGSLHLIEFHSFFSELNLSICCSCFGDAVIAIVVVVVVFAAAPMKEKKNGEKTNTDKARKQHGKQKNNSSE